jgi:hypothetical protein
MVGVAALIVGLVANYVRFIEKMELFVAKEEAIAQTEQLKIILNELDNGIIIFREILGNKFLTKFINNKINLLFGNAPGMTHSSEDSQCLDS